MTTTRKVTELPNKNVVLDLDAVERDEDDRPPFVVSIAGREITMVDPDTVDWRDLITMTDPTDFLRIAMSAEDRRYLSEQSIPGWKFGKLLEAYYAHYDLDDKIGQARRRAALG